MVAILSFLVLCNLALVAATAWAPVSADRRAALRSVLAWSAIWAGGLAVSYVFAFLALTVAGSEQAIRLSLIFLMGAIAVPVTAGTAALAYGAAALAKPSMFSTAGDRASLALYVSLAATAVILMATGGVVSAADWPGYLIAMLVVPSIAWAVRAPAPAKAGRAPLQAPRPVPSKAVAKRHSVPVTARRVEPVVQRQRAVTQPQKVRPAVRPDRNEAVSRGAPSTVRRTPSPAPEPRFPAQKSRPSDIIRQIERLAADLKVSIGTHPLPAFAQPAPAQRHTESRPAASSAPRLRAAQPASPAPTRPRDWPTLIGGPLEDGDFH